MRRHFTSRISLAVLGCAALLLTRPILADGPDLRMQRVLARFVEETGHAVIGLGSWVSGVYFNPASSDFDMRLVLGEGATEAQLADVAEAQRAHLLAQWREARGRLASLIRTEFGSDAGSVLARANLYPPNQLMVGVENTADAIERFERLNAVPSLSYSGPVTASTPAKYVEGLYGSGSQTWVQRYERAAGRLFYSNNGKCVTGLSELAHLGEGTATYTAAGTASTAGQWAEHAVVELEAGHGDKVAKFLDRLERDLIKSRSLSRLPLDEAYRAELRRMRDLLKNSPGRLTEVAGDVARLLSRGRAEAAILGSFENAGPLRRAYLRVMLDGVAAGNKLGTLLDQVMKKAPSWVDGENVMSFVIFSIGTHAAAQSVGRGDDVFEAMSNVFGAVNPLRMIGPALLAETMAEIIVQAKANGYDMAAGFQDAWDLMAGIYSAWGRAGVDPDPRRTLTLADMVANFQYERSLEAIVMAQAIRASTRGLGTANAQADTGVAQAIFDECWPPIRDAWRWERDSLATEYLKLASGVVHTPVVIYYKPADPKAGETVNLEAVSATRKLSDRLERMKQIIRILYGTGSGVAVNYYWDPAGEGGEGRGWQRTMSFAEPGKHPVKVRLEVSPFASHTETEPRVMLKREVPALVDVEVVGDNEKKPVVPAGFGLNVTGEKKMPVSLYASYMGDIVHSDSFNLALRSSVSIQSADMTAWPVEVAGSGPDAWRAMYDVMPGQPVHVSLSVTATASHSSLSVPVPLPSSASCTLTIPAPEVVYRITENGPGGTISEKEQRGGSYTLDYMPRKGHGITIEVYAYVNYTAKFSGPMVGNSQTTFEEQERPIVVTVNLDGVGK